MLNPAPTQWIAWSAFVTGWVAGALALVGYSFAAEARGWPTVVPRHHLMSYLRVAQPVLNGYGAAALWSAARRRIDRSKLPATPIGTLARGPAVWAAIRGL